MSSEVSVSHSVNRGRGGGVTNPTGILSSLWSFFVETIDTFNGTYVNTVKLHCGF